MARYRERMDELEREHKQRVSLDLIGRATRVAERLRRLNEPSRILVTYYDVDEPLSELERYVHEAVLALDREIQHQIDLARGSNHPRSVAPARGVSSSSTRASSSRRRSSPARTAAPRARSASS